MIIGHLNLIRLVLFGFALIDSRKTNFTSWRDTQDYTGLHRPSQASTGLHMTLRIHRYTGEMLVLNQSYFRTRARNGPPVRLVIAQTFHKKKSEAKLVSAPRWELSLFTLPWPRWSVIHHPSSVICQLSPSMSRAPEQESSIAWHVSHPDTTSFFKVR